MEPGVPFPLLAGVELLAASAALGLAAASCTRRVWSSLAPLLALGALVLAVTEGVTAVSFGAADSSALLWWRAVGFTLVGIGLWPAGRQPPPPEWPPQPWGRLRRVLPGAPAAVPGVALAVVVPLGGSVPAAAAATVAGLGAALVAVDHARDGSRGRRRPAVLLALGLALAAASCALAPAAVSSYPAAMGVLVLRAAGAVALVGLLALLARYSVLGKVVGVLVVGALTVGVTAVAVVGTVVEASLQQAQREEAEAIASGRVRDLLEDRDQVRRAAELVTLCSQGPVSCQQVLGLTQRGAAAPVAGFVQPDGEVRVVQGFLKPATRAALLDSPLVQAVLEAEGGAGPGVGELVRLEGAEVPLALLGVASAFEPGAEPGGAGFYLVPIDGTLLQAAADVTGAYELSAVVDGEVVSTSLEPEEAEELQRTVAASGALTGPLGPRGTLLDASGDSPLVHLQSLVGPEGDPQAVLAVSRAADDALAAERQALTRLVLVALGLTVLLAAAGFVLSRQLVKPVARLTAAAARVSSGDLDTRADVRSHDELGRLAGAFDGMTTSLAGLAGDLRLAADEESRLRQDLETVLASLSDGVVVVREAGQVTRANAAALSLLGADSEADVLGRPVAEVLPLRGFDPLVEDHGEGDLVRPDGATLPVACAAAPLAGGGGRVLVLRDQTRERDVERMKTEFLSNVSHELRTPLTPIRGYADLLLRKPGLPPEQAVLYAAAILDACLRLTKVVDLLVDVAALEAGRVVPELRSVHAGDLLGNRVDGWRRSVPEREADLRLSVDPGLPPLSIDPFWLGRALDELVDNALKHTPPGTPVTLAAEARSGASVALVVRDAGPGIALQDRGRLLDSFEQADASATRSVGGLGLGLAFVRRLSEDFGLQMRLESERGWGTEVTLVVPADLRPRLLDDRVGAA
jgi:signal transduction histidine kinase/HAMP domain-containing protein